MAALGRTDFVDTIFAKGTFALFFFTARFADGDISEEPSSFRAARDSRKGNLTDACPTLFNQRDLAQMVSWMIVAKWRHGFVPGAQCCLRDVITTPSKLPTKSERCGSCCATNVFAILAAIVCMFMSWQWPWPVSVSTAATCE